MTTVIDRTEAGKDELQIKAHFHQPFVVKKHDATRLHYDFRLGWNGVMKSWALPMGPSYWPGEGRQAIQVPDHCREHIAFEGVIPEPRYGAGAVMQWDCGIWAPQPEYLDVDSALSDGHLGLILYGKKLKGSWTLIRTESREGQNPVWLLIKEPDSFARNLQSRSILEEQPNSVLTGKSLEEIEWDWNNGKSENLMPSLFEI